MSLKESPQLREEVTNPAHKKPIGLGYIRTYDIEPDLLEAYYKAAEISGFAVSHIANPGEFMLQQTDKTYLTRVYNYDSQKPGNRNKVPKVVRVTAINVHRIPDGKIGIAVRKPYRENFRLFDDALKAQLHPPVHSAQRIQR